MDWLGELDRLAVEKRLRGLRALVADGAVAGRLDGQDVVLFSSNDYFGLSCHPEVRQAAAEIAARRGMGSRGATLICGYSEVHEALEIALAELKGTESALLFPTGYQANLGLLSALGGEETVFFSDRLNHASIIDGIRLGRSRVHVYRHGDMAHLEELLSAEGGRKVIVTDALFSMDGDLAPIAALVELRERYGALLVVDEAHATLVYGGGLIQSLGLSDQVDFVVGTLSKAVGSHGGFVACSSQKRSWLLNTARAFIFTTALPLPVVAAALAAIKVFEQEPGLHQRLWRNIELLGQLLGRRLESPVAPVILGTEERVLEAAKELLAQGLHVIPIRPPTVPEGTCRLRVAVSAGHSEDQLARLASLLPRA